MVDFKAENTITTPNYQIVSVVKLELWVNCILAFESLESNDPNADDYHNIVILQARLKALFRCIHSWYTSIAGKEAAQELRSQLDSGKLDQLESSYNTMSAFLFENGLTKINLRKQGFSVIAEDVNNDKGF